jgi:hypothetical protein
LSVDNGEGDVLVVFVSLVQLDRRNVVSVSDGAGPVDREREVCVWSIRHTGSTTELGVLAAFEVLDEVSVGFGVRDSEFAIAHDFSFIGGLIIGDEICAKEKTREGFL